MINVSLTQERTNCTSVRIGGLSLYFSYETIIGYYTSEEGKVLSENVWSTTTGKHLNHFGDKSDRVPRAEFLERLEKVLEKHGLNGEGR